MRTEAAGEECTHHFQTKSRVGQMIGIKRRTRWKSASVHRRGTIPRYSVENPIAGATTAYRGKKSIVKMKEPGIAADMVRDS